MKNQKNRDLFLRSVSYISKLDITYHPQIIKTKLINKQKDLKIIREKFNDNKVLDINGMLFTDSIAVV